MNPWLIGAPSTIAAGVAGITAYGAAYPRAQLFGPTVCRTRSAKQLALTFDDGPDPAWTPRILDILKAKGVPAAFFVVGAEVEKNICIVVMEKKHRPARMPRVTLPGGEGASGTPAAMRP